MDGDMMMDKKKEEEDKGPNGCLVCLEATWNGMVVSKYFLIVLNLPLFFRPFTMSSNT